MEGEEEVAAEVDVDEVEGHDDACICHHMIPNLHMLDCWFI